MNNRLTTGLINNILLQTDSNFEHRRHCLQDWLYTESGSGGSEGDLFARCLEVINDQPADGYGLFKDLVRESELAEPGLSMSVLEDLQNFVSNLVNNSQYTIKYDRDGFLSSQAETHSEVLGNTDAFKRCHVSGFYIAEAAEDDRILSESDVRAILKWFRDNPRLSISKTDLITPVHERTPEQVKALECYFNRAFITAETFDKYPDPIVHAAKEYLEAQRVLHGL